MRVLILTLALSTSLFANERILEMTCDSSQNMLIEDNFNRVQNFRMPQFQLTNVTRTGNAAFITVQERFGAGWMTFNRVWTNSNARCLANHTCINTDFSWMRGLTFNIPNSAFEADYSNFTMRLRNNRFNRTYFLSCRSYTR
jgi:hypothetical protein